MRTNTQNIDREIEKSHLFVLNSDNCGTTCNIQSARNFKCDDTSAGVLGNTRTCTCVEDCREYDVECASNGNWVQKVTLDTIQNKIECNCRF
jgi:hypothetical protein